MARSRDVTSKRKREPQVRPASTPDPSVRAKILVIDDEPYILRAVERTLRKSHDVVCVDSGEAALGQLAHASFDVILCDLNMPGMSGADLFEVVEARYPTQAARFVAMTGGTFAERAQQFLETNGIRCVLKPLSEEQLRAIIAERMAASSQG